MGKPHIVAIGAAVQDVFLQGKIFKPHKDGSDLVQEFELGTKNDIDGVVFSSGGGATNAAVTFARLGFHSQFMGRVGKDIAGKAVIDSLHAEGVDTALVDYSSKYSTGYSTLLLAPSGERTILTYRGASEVMGFRETDFHHIVPEWIYVSSLAGDFVALEHIIAYARKHDIKVAINPGKGELKHSHDFKALLPQISILSVNKEEMQKLFHGDTSEELIKKAIEHVPVVIITDGPKGSVASDGKRLYKAGMYEDVPVIDRTGAGDAFSSGFTAVIAAGESMETAITYASANSTSVVGKIGAKEGILHEHVRLHRMPITVQEI